jgi:D-3-phosphoglycerate dehydrogenase / 2-oxoglutarate reductase
VHPPGQPVGWAERSGAVLEAPAFVAGLDVFDAEPMPADHPLLTLDNVVITPHTSASVFDNVPNVARHVLGNIMRVVKGEELPSADVIVPPKH